jgi:hypothetical protein
MIERHATSPLASSFTVMRRPPAIGIIVDMPACSTPGTARTRRRISAWSGTMPLRSYGVPRVSIDTSVTPDAANPPSSCAMLRKVVISNDAALVSRSANDSCATTTPRSSIRRLPPTVPRPPSLSEMLRSVCVARNAGTSPNSVTHAIDITAVNKSSAGFGCHRTISA